MRRLGASSCGLGVIVGAAVTIAETSSRRLDMAVTKLSFRLTLLRSLMVTGSLTLGARWLN